MKIGVFSAIFRKQNLSLAQMLQKLNDFGVHTVELASGGQPGTDQCNPAVLNKDQGALSEFKTTIKEYGFEISALSCHSNALNPNKEKRELARSYLKEAILLAERLGVATVNTFPGCPGDGPGARYPNFAAGNWPKEQTELLKYQWEEEIIPFWRQMSVFAKSHNVRIGFEMEAGESVHSLRTLKKLRDALGDNASVIGANFDPSHCAWMGMSPVEMIKGLAKENALFHFHAKDTQLYKRNIEENGILESRYLENPQRPWVFRTVGYGNSLEYWKDIISALKFAGYDGSVSIEHEDFLMSREEGIQKAISFLKQIIIEDKPTDSF